MTRRRSVLDPLELRGPAAERRLLDRAPATHINSPTPPPRGGRGGRVRLLKLCQEWVMRAGEYDDRARVQFVAESGIEISRPGDYLIDTTHVLDTTFHLGVQQVGLEAAIAAVWRCLWVSGSDFKGPDPVPCAECLEVARS